MIFIRAAAVTVLVLAVAACGGRQTTRTTPEPEPSAPAQTETAPAPRSGPAEPVLTPQEQRELALRQLLGQRTLYFDYDESDIKPEFMDIIEAHAKNLVRNPSTRILLEGHCDERGSREYNIGLGERRAHAVRRAMLVQGVSADQISTISYGEERPAVPGHSESAWSRNRRVEIVYR